jgi:hypothetical protein
MPAQSSEYGTIRDNQTLASRNADVLAGSDTSQSSGRGVFRGVIEVSKVVSLCNDPCSCAIRQRSTSSAISSSATNVQKLWME